MCEPTQTDVHLRKCKIHINSINVKIFKKQMDVPNASFEFKQPIIVSKTPSIIYAFQLLETVSIDKTYSEKVDYSVIVNDNIAFVSSLIGSFCQKCSKYFSRPLDANRLLSRLVHSDYAVNVENEDDADAHSEPVIYEWKYTPYRIIISGTELKVEWCIDQIEIKCMIDIHVDDDHNIEINSNNIDASLNHVNEVVTERVGGVVTEIINVDEVKKEEAKEVEIEEPPEVQLGEVNIPVSEDSTPIAVKVSGRTEDYKRLRKAQLRVEMAKFKAERAYAKYVERWGYLSEDSGSDSE